MPDGSTTSDAFESFLTELARAPEALMRASQLPPTVESASMLDNRFWVERLVGSGGSAEVFVATDTLLHRSVALKIARDPLGGPGTRRWRREAEALAQLVHPNIVRVFRVGAFQDRPLIEMEWVDGRTLAQHVRDEPRSWREILRLYREAGRGLAAAHAAGLVHRDFKPHNALVGTDGRVRVADFGLVSLATDTTPRSSSGHDEETGRVGLWTERLTHGALGTHGYMPPEQFDGGDADPRSDQFSFCAALFEALTGQVPYPGETLEAARDRALAGRLETPANASAPGWVFKALHRGLRPEPRDRFADMQALLDALEPQRHLRARRRVFTAVVLCVGLFGAAWVWTLSVTPDPDCVSSLAGTWDESRAGKLRDGFDATASRDAAEASQQAIATLDAWAEQWIERRMDVCEQGEKRPNADARIACLERNRGATEGVLRVLLEPDASVVASQATLLAELEPPTHCDDPTLFEAERLDPAQAALVQDARRSIAASNAQRVAGRVADAAESADHALEVAQASRFEPVIAEAMHARGLGKVARGRNQAGFDDLLEAHWSATALKHDVLAARAARSVLSNDVVSLQGWAEAQRWSRLAEASEIRSGVEGPSWQLLEARARAASRAFRLDEARTDFVETLRRMPNDDAHGAERATVLLLLASVEANGGRTEAARTRVMEALDVAEATLPDDHDVRAHALEKLGLVAHAVGDISAGVDAIERSLAMTTRLHGRASLRVVYGLTALAQIFRTSGQANEALAAEQEALEISLTLPGSTRLRQAKIRTGIATTLHAMERYDEALEQIEAALRDFDAADGTRALDRAGALTTLSQTHIALGNADAALDANEAALALTYQVTPESGRVAGLLSDRAMINLYIRRDPEAALENLREAHALAEKVNPHDLLRRIVKLESIAWAYVVAQAQGIDISDPG